MNSPAINIQGTAVNRVTVRRVTPLTLVGLLAAHRELIYRLTRRELEARYRGSVLGILWTFVVPLAMLAVYTFVFAGIFQAKWPIPADGRGSFFLIFFAGLVLMNFFGDCVSRAPSLLLSNVSYIKKVVFPLEILPVVSVLGALFDTAAAFAVLVIFYVATAGLPFWQAVLLPVLFAPLAILAMGLSWFLSALGVYVRDLRQAVGVVLAAMPFLCPLFFDLSQFERFGPWAVRATYLHPLTIPLIQVRQVLFYNQIPSWPLWAAYTAAAVLVAYLGLVWFMYTQRGFADVV